MKLTVVKSKNATLYYVQKSYRTDDGRSSTKTVERLGTISELEARFGTEDPVGAARAYVRELTEADKEQRRDIVVRFSQEAMLKKGERRRFNGGYLFLQKIYYELGMDRICRQIEKRHRNGYDLNGILSRLLYTRILYPGSKASALEESGRFIERPEMELHQIYRALTLLAEESDEIQRAVYRNSLRLWDRNTKVLYYDCTNYYFESEEESGLRQYGHSKEHRPSPIVQMGLFTDMDGMPLAFCINPGNTSEQVTLKPLERKLNDDFGISRLVVCTDCGLSSYENRRNDAVGERAFITVQSLKSGGRQPGGTSQRSVLQGPVDERERTGAEADSDLLLQVHGISPLRKGQTDREGGENNQERSGGDGLEKPERPETLHIAGVVYSRRGGGPGDKLLAQ